MKNVKKIKKNVEKKLNEEEAKIFDAHLEILNDPELFEKTKEIIINNNNNIIINNSYKL